MYYQDVLMMILDKPRSFGGKYGKMLIYEIFGNIFDFTNESHD